MKLQRMHCFPQIIDLGRPGLANLIYYLLQASTDERKRYAHRNSVDSTQLLSLIKFNFKLDEYKKSNNHSIENINSIA